jgi:hypothetical protein
MKTNLHTSVIDTAVVTDDGSIMTEPSRADHPSFTDYQKAKTAFLTGRKVPNDPK